MNNLDRYNQRITLIIFSGFEEKKSDFFLMSKKNSNLAIENQ